MTEWKTDKVTYQEKGSYRFTKEQRNSYALILDVKILSYVGQSYENLKGNPSYGFWGVASIFEGSTVRERIPVEYPKFRLLNVINSDAAALFTALILEETEDGIILTVGEGIDRTWDLLTVEGYAPILSHREEVVKFVGQNLSQFEFTCYWLGFPRPPAQFPGFADDPPTDGEDEYYEPRRNPLGNPYRGNPDPSAPGELSDPRDFGEPVFTPETLSELRYEFFNPAASGGGFQPRTRGPVKTPGKLVRIGSDPQQNTVAYEDFEGTVTVLAGPTSADARVRNVRAVTEFGSVFRLTPDSLDVFTTLG